MHAEDRPIHFSTELFHMPCKHEKSVLQKLYFELSQTQHGGYDGSDFSVPGQCRFHSKRGAKTQSIALFMMDRIVLMEEWVDIPLVTFLKKAEAIAGGAMDTLGIRFFPAHSATVRTTFALTHFEDARVFLIDHMCKQEGRIGPSFGRPVAVGGLRFVLPETPDHPGTYHVTIESFRHSLDEVYVEVKAVFGRQRMDADSLSVLGDSFRHVREFICNQVYSFMNEYDTPQEKNA